MAPAKSMSMASWTVPGIPGFLQELGGLDLDV